MISPIFTKIRYHGCYVLHVSCFYVKDLNLEVMKELCIYIDILVLTVIGNLCGHGKYEIVLLTCLADKLGHFHTYEFKISLLSILFL